MAGVEVLILRDSVQPALKPSEKESPIAAENPNSAVLMDESLREELSAIPDKMAFKIGEVADMAGVKTYVLRYWETEFDILKPKKSSSNQRMYSKKDVENTLLIKKLLYRDRFSIEGARKALKSLKTEVREEKQWTTVVNRVDRAAQEVEELIEMIDRARESFQSL